MWSSMRNSFRQFQREISQFFLLCLFPLFSCQLRDSQKRTLSCRRPNTIWCWSKVHVTSKLNGWGEFFLICVETLWAFYSLWCSSCAITIWLALRVCSVGIYTYIPTTTKTYSVELETTYLDLGKLCIFWWIDFKLGSVTSVGTVIWHKSFDLYITRFYGIYFYIYTNVKRTTFWKPFLKNKFPQKYILWFSMALPS